VYQGRRVGVQSVADPDTEVTGDRLRQLEYCLPPSLFFALCWRLAESHRTDGSVENVVRSLYETKESVANVLGFYRSEADHMVRLAKAVDLARADWPLCGYDATQVYAVFDWPAGAVSLREYLQDKNRFAQS